MSLPNDRLSELCSLGCRLNNSIGKALSKFLGSCSGLNTFSLSSKNYFSHELQYTFTLIFCKLSVRPHQLYKQQNMMYLRSIPAFALYKIETFVHPGSKQWGTISKNFPLFRAYVYASTPTILGCFSRSVFVYSCIYFLPSKENM